MGSNSTSAENILKRLTKCKVIVKKSEEKNKVVTYNGCDSSSALMNKIEELVRVILDDKKAYQNDANFIAKLGKFKNGFLTEHKKSGDVKYVWHRNIRFYENKKQIQLPATPKLLRKADLFVAIHRSQIVNLMHELSE